MSTALELPTDADVRAAAIELEGAPATDVLRWAATAIPRFCITSSFGADAAVLLSLVAEVDPDIPVLFLETGFHFAESLAYRHQLADLLGLRAVIDVTPALTVEQQAREHGAGLYLRDPDACCALRKVAPLDDALAGYDGWATGVRRSQTAERAGTPIVTTATTGGRVLLKVAPLATWTAADVAGHRRLHGLPPHPLAERGFSSIGCAPCTRAVAPGEDPRSGRWAGQSKTECGIHLEGPER
ncbi:phosphoadenylyl-sulfate reductase [Euzebya sp.]|uniref:phosphoadenylyl-sulfate reductase n=1 Tax=Euzebya sp. TaxID=1971409 RepID=UPI003510EA43